MKIINFICFFVGQQVGDLFEAKINSSTKMAKKSGADSKFFSSSKKGENHELREELRSPQRDRKRDAVKKVDLF